MATGVFGLRGVHIKQYQNIDNKNFASWPESATYGYFGGGANPPFPTRTNILSRLDFSNETLSNPGRNLPSAIDNNAAVTSSSYGYFGGGLTAPTTFINTVSRLDFSNETISLPGKNLPVATSDMGGVSGSSYGYFGGGSTPTIVSTVSRLDFSSETLSLPGKNLPVATALLTATSSTSYGYFGAGFPAYVCTISRLDFSTENVSLPGKDLPYGRYTLAATSSNYYGYFGGGQITVSTYSSVISRLDFSTEGTSSFPTQGALQDAAVGNSSYGYFGGGEVNTIRRFDFSNETIGLPGNNFPLSVSSQGALSGGQSVYRSFSGSKIYTRGYFAGGQTPGPPFIFRCTVFRIDFSTEVVNTPLGNIPAQRIRHSSTSNGLYGYVLGGDAFSLTGRSNIFRHDFSTETSSDPGKTIPPPSNGTIQATTIENNLYGFYCGGLSLIPPSSPTLSLFSTITKLDFSNETTNNSRNNLPKNTYGLSGISNKSYGYFSGGYDTDYNSVVSRFDFSTEILSLPGKNSSLLASTELKGLSSNYYNYGYFVGGVDNSSRFNTISRLDFSNETLSLPGKNLPTSRSSFSVTSSKFYGYFGGGYFDPPGAPSTTCFIQRLDFSTENISNATNNLPSIINYLSGFSN